MKEVGLLRVFLIISGFLGGLRWDTDITTATVLTLCSLEFLEK